MTLEAHYTNISKSRAAAEGSPTARGILTFATRTGTDREYGVRLFVEGKRQARKLAAEHGAQPWNF